jgi:hypothetical protein
MASVTHVIPRTLTQCTEVLDQLMTLRVVSFFIAYEGLAGDHPTAFFEQNPRFPSLGDISAKLKGGGYSLPAEFYWDVLGIFAAFSHFFKDDDTPDGQAFCCLASFGTLSFMKACAKAARTEMETYLYEIRKALKRAADLQGYPLGGQVARAYHVAVGPESGHCDFPGKVDPIEYYPIE